MLALLSAIALAACSDGPTVVVDPDPPAASSPDSGSSLPPNEGGLTAEVAIESFLTALEEGSSEAGEMVAPNQLALLIGVEEPTGDLMTGLLTDGVEPEVASNFWQSFSESFEPFAGTNLAGWETGESRAVISDGTTFVFVTVEHELGESELVAAEAGGAWFVDIVASFGHAFAPVFNHWLDGEPVRQAEWEDAMIDQRVSVLMAMDRTDPDSIYQQDLAGWLDRISRLQP